MFEHIVFLVLQSQKLGKLNNLGMTSSQRQAWRNTRQLCSIEWFRNTQAKHRSYRLVIHTRRISFSALCFCSSSRIFSSYWLYSFLVISLMTSALASCDDSTYERGKLTCQSVQHCWEQEEWSSRDVRVALWTSAPPCYDTAEADFHLHQDHSQYSANI